jgi:hypothetical protein
MVALLIILGYNSFMASLISPCGLPLWESHYLNNDILCHFFPRFFVPIPFQPGNMLETRGFFLVLNMLGHGGQHD